MRRSSEDLRALLLDAAAQRFTTSDYASTSTRSIAAEAGVAESVLFRHFGTKANLLAASVAEPFANFLRSFSATWEAEYAPGAEERIVRAFVADLTRELLARRDVVRTLFAASGTPDAAAVVADAQAQLADTFGALEDIMRVSEGRRGGGVEPVAVRVRAVCGMIVALVVFDDWFLGDDVPDDLVDQLTRLTLYGVRGTP